MTARRRKSAPPEPGPPQVPPQAGLQLLEGLKERAQSLLANRPLSSDDHSQWKVLARNFLEKAFGVESPNVKSVTDVGVYGSFPMGASEAWWEDHRAKSLTTQISRLDGLIELLRTEIQLTSAGTLETRTEAVGHKIFLVHGHDEAALHATARFLEQLRQDFVVLREQPNKGRTIIEKFEDYADVGFAVVLLTPDDRGGPADTPCEQQSLRARENVILELGYFLGRLGRARVCALYMPGVAIPSDYTGVAYVELDDRGAWRLELGRELKAAGFEIDLNLAI